MLKTNDASIPKAARRGRKRKVTICLITSHYWNFFGVIILDAISFNDRLCINFNVWHSAPPFQVSERFAGMKVFPECFTSIYYFLT